MGSDDIINQKMAKRHLLLALKSGRIPNAFLFSGPQGVGKTFTALTIARILNCETREFDCCDTCPSCVKINHFQHPEVEFVFPVPSWYKKEAAGAELEKRASLRWKILSRKIESPLSTEFFDEKTSISIGEIKVLLRMSSIRILHGKWRVFVISQAERMRDDAQNAFLKLLEEPKENTLIILVSSKPHLLLPTVLSRCQEIKFAELGRDEIEKFLVERLSAPAERAGLVASLSQGSLGRALELLDEEVFEDRKASFNFLMASLSNDIVTILSEMNRVSRDTDRRYVHRVVENILLLHRDILSFQHGGRKEYLANKDMLDFIEGESGRLSYVELGRRVSVLMKGLDALDRNVAPGLVMHEISYRLGTQY